MIALEKTKDKMSEKLFDLYSRLKIYTQETLELNDPDRIIEVGNDFQRCFWDYTDNNRGHKIKNLTGFMICFFDGKHKSKIYKFYRKFNKISKTIPVSGVILLNPSRDEVFLVKNYGAKVWSYPKGKVEKGETDTVCAIRECYEEITYSPNITSENKTLEVHTNSRNGTFYIIENVKKHYGLRKSRC